MTNTHLCLCLSASCSRWHASNVAGSRPRALAQEQPAHVRAVSSAHERRVEFGGPSELHSTAAQPSATQRDGTPQQQRSACANVAHGVKSARRTHTLYVRVCHTREPAPPVVERRVTAGGWVRVCAENANVGVVLPALTLQIFTFPPFFTFLMSLKSDEIRRVWVLPFHFSRDVFNSLHFCRDGRCQGAWWGGGGTSVGPTGGGHHACSEWTCCGSALVVLTPTIFLSRPLHVVWR
jgi:hypothetical protein